MSTAERVLSNGRYAVVLTSAGTGASTWKGLALTAWRGDRIDDADGVFVYVQDLDTGALWSIGRQPVPVVPDAYEARASARVVTIVRRQGDLEASLATCVAADVDVELRHIRLVNHGERARRLAVTTYVEVVLNDPGAHAAHPAFSKLFVETEWAPAERALLARRRPRAATDRVAWMVHAFAGPGDVEYESARPAFLGRGRSVAAPRALASAAPLGGGTGSVLDPVFALRRRVTLAPGASVELVALVGAAESRAGALALVAHAREGFPTFDEAETTLAAAPWPAPRYVAAPRVATPSPPAGDLRFDNGYGGLSADGDYVIRVDADRRPPMPWINVVANDRVGFLVSEAGAGYTWSRNSREHRLTPWSNDPIVDPHGEALYVRDEEAGVFWSPLPGPVPPPAAVECRHGFGWSRWRHTSRQLAHDVQMFVPADDPVKIVRLRLANEGPTPRRLSVFSFAHLVLGVVPAETAASVTTSFDDASGALVAVNPHGGDFADGVVFAAAVGTADVRHTADRGAFLGAHGSPSRPAALLADAPLDGRTGGVDPCAAFEVPVVVASGATVEVAFLLGEAPDLATARALVGRYRRPGALDEALEAVRAEWRATLGAVQVETPVPALDVMMNGWLGYQNLACRIRGRSAFYQSGGAFGFRDQLQDAAALVYCRPELTRAQIVLHAAHQFVAGDVLHWWHPPRDRGTRTRFSDDLVWLPYVTAFYVRTTGDRSVLDEPAAFVTARVLAPGEDEAYLLPERTAERASVYEHCCRALDRALTRGAHGLPLMGTGDWNDGMNRVGREGRGESVWLAFFLCHVLDLFLPLIQARGDDARARRYVAYRQALRGAVNDAGWDGDWYRRAYYDDGTPLGSAANDECRIDALAQAWAVISGVAPPDRAARAMDAVDRMLVDDDAGIVRLLTPPFDETAHDPGYIKGYVPGIRENGGQYTHAALWVVRALAELGRRERAAAVLEMLGPLHHASTPADVAVYQVEPYVVAADVYGVAPHVGRGGWTWYTGSAGWMYRVMLESILGLTIEGGATLRLRPRAPDTWPGFRIVLRRPDGTRYEITVTNPTGDASAVAALSVDGTVGSIREGAAVVPLAGDGASHRVEIRLGAVDSRRRDP